MKTIFYLRKVIFLCLLICSFSCSNDWLSESMEPGEAFDISEGAVEIKGSGGSYFAGSGEYSFQAIPPTGWTMTGLTWSIDGAGGIIKGTNTANPVIISFNTAGYADVMISCQLRSGVTTRNHTQVLTVKVIDQYPILYIEKVVLLPPENTYIAKAAYSAIGSAIYEWSIPSDLTYNYITSNRSEIEIIYPPASKEYRIGVRVKDGNHYTDWVYETVKTSGDFTTTFFIHSIDNGYTGDYCDFEIIVSHNDYPETPETYYYNTDRLERYGSCHVDNNTMLIKGNYTVKLRHTDYGGNWTDYKVYQINLQEGGGIYATLYGSYYDYTWGTVQFCELTCVDL